MHEKLDRRKIAMFSSLFDYSVKRSALQAIGFYIVHLILIAITCGIITAIWGIITGGTGFENGTKVGHVSAIFICMILASLIAYQKKKNLLTICLVLASVALSVFSAQVGGLIPMAFLTTTESNA